MKPLPPIEKEDAFKIIFKAFYTTLYCFTQRFVKDSEAARDITQEAFLKLFQKWEFLEFSEATKAYLYTTAKNLCIDYFRKEKMIHSYELGRRPSVFIEENFLQEITKQETIYQLHLAIAELPVQARQVILYSLGEKSNAEIAEFMGITVNTVKSHKKLAYKILKEKLSVEYYLAFLFMINWF